MPLRLFKNLDPLPDPASTAEPGTGVASHLRTILLLVTSQFREMEQKSGLAATQIWALNVVAANESLGVSALADTMGIHQSTASNILKPLLERGLVDAKRSGEDRRAVHLKLTAKGKRLLAKAPGPFTGVLTAGSGELDPATLRRLERDLGRLVEVLQTKIAADKAVRPPH
ncbi:MAG: MarR family transcriptional regulator [Sphingomonadales bacterium]|nr:MAG: MarR family transcriptional regulator [Sphingomonadales bacterium]